MSGRMILIVGVAAAALAGCQSRSQEPTREVRSSVVTAPADLQLFCASTAANQFGVDSGEVLPVASEAIGGGQYTVRLTVPGGNATCVIDDEANVASIARV